MGNGSLIGALAIFTIGAALVAAIAYFAYFLSSSKNRESTHRTLVRDETAAGSPDDQRSGTQAPIKERLDNSEASGHPDDPKREVAAR